MENTKLMEQNVKTCIPQFGQILIGDERSRSLSSVYFANPSPLEERNFGHLFLVMDIQNSEHEDNKKILSFLEQELRHAYYYSEHFSIEEAFEQALQDTNQKIQSLANSIGSGWMNQINILVGVLKGQALTLSHAGSIHAFLVQNDHILDIIDQKTPPGSLVPNRLFGNMLTGEISPKNTMLFCTPNFLDYFSLEKIKKTISGSSVEQNTNDMIHLLSENENQDSFGAILLRLKPVNSDETLPASSSTTVIQKLNQEIAHAAETDSMHQLVHQEQATSELLTPSLWPVVKKNLKNFVNDSQQFVRQRLFGASIPSYQPRNIQDHSEPSELRLNKPSRATLQPSVSVKTLPFNLGLRMIKTMLKFLQFVGVKLLTMVVYAGRLGTQLFQRRGRIQVRSQFQRLPHHASNHFARLLQRFKSMSRPRQILFVLSILFIFLFAQSIIRLGERNERSEQRALWEENLEKIRVNLVEAEAAMNYDNNEGALTFLGSASQLLSTIPAEAKSFDEQKQQLSGQIRRLQSQINKITVLDQPMLFSDLARIHPALQASHLQVAGSTLLAFDANNGSIYQASENPSTLSSRPELASAIHSTAGDEQGRVMILRSDGTLTQMKDAEESSLPIQFSNQDRALIAISYLSPGRLYVLDQKNKQIFKHTAIAESFGTGVPWLTDTSIPLEDSKGMAIDGSIYVLQSDGNVIKLFGGQKQAFSLTTVEPALTGATKIYTSENTSGIYVLDPNNKRIVVFDKQGAVIAQYVSDAFDNLLDFSVAESQQQLFALNGQKIYRIDLNASDSP